MGWTIFSEDISPGQLRPLEFTDSEYHIYQVFAVWMGQGRIKYVEIVDININRGYRLTFENLIKRVKNKQLIQI